MKCFNGVAERFWATNALQSAGKCRKSAMVHKTKIIKQRITGIIKIKR